MVADVRACAVMKAREVGELREQTLGEEPRGAGRRGRGAAAAASIGAASCWRSATAARRPTRWTLVADLRYPPSGTVGARDAAIDLTEDTAIITAVGNDVGIEVIFQRQVIAYGRQGDALVALSTSGNSANVIVALEEARSREMTTIAFVGYDGGRIAAEGLADHVVITRSQHIPRIQEAQASAYHALRELIELDPPGAVQPG